VNSHESKPHIPNSDSRRWRGAWRDRWPELTIERGQGRPDVTRHVDRPVRVGAARCRGNRRLGRSQPPRRGLRHHRRPPLCHHGSRNSDASRSRLARPQLAVHAEPAREGANPRHISPFALRHLRRNRPLRRRRPLPRRRASHARLRLLSRQGADGQGRPASLDSRTPALLGCLRDRNRNSDRPLGTDQGVLERRCDERGRETRNRRRRRPWRPHARGAVDRHRSAAGRRRLHDRRGAPDRRCIPPQAHVHIQTRRRSHVRHIQTRRRSHVHHDHRRTGGGRSGRARRRRRSLRRNQAVLTRPDPRRMGSSSDPDGHPRLDRRAGGQGQLQRHRKRAASQGAARAPKAA